MRTIKLFSNLIIFAVVSLCMVQYKYTLSRRYSLNVPGSREERNAVLFPSTSFQQSKDPLFNVTEVLKELNDREAPMDDPTLIRIIRDYFIELPSLEPYNLTYPNKLEYSKGQTPFIDSRLNNMENGFYVECGALDGERGSNSLFFEKVRKWNGVLIEADPSNFEKLRKKHRKAFIINACLSPYPYPSKMKFNQAFNRGKLIYGSAKEWIKNHKIRSKEVEVQCFPLYSILLALDQTTVDFFSLDVEGNELDVLKTVPFEKVNIKMITAEVAHQTNKNDMQKLMGKNKYKTLLKMHTDNNGVNDIIFMKKGFEGSNIWINY